VNINESLKGTGRGVTDSGPRMTLAKALVISQVSLSLLLVMGAGLFLRTLWNLQSAGVGYPKENLLVMALNAAPAGFKETRLATFFHDIGDRLRTLPGVRDVTWSVNGLFTPSDEQDTIEAEGFTPASEGDRNSLYDEVGPGYFSALGIPILLGREIGAQDRAASPRVCVINEAFAQRFFQGRNPIGKHVTDTYGDKRFTMEVVGVVRDARDHAARGTLPIRGRGRPPRFYAVLEQGIDGISPDVFFEIRTTGDPNRMVKPVRKAILDMNPDAAVGALQPLVSLIDQSNAQPRLVARLSTIFGVLALLLAATGLYGVLSYGVARRTNEIGIRMALGSGKSRVIGMILRETSVTIAIGLIVGAAAAAACTRFIASRLYGLSAMDPLTILAAATVLCAVALIAAFIPATRAARVSPVKALRME
jgi:predicted permease